MKALFFTIPMFILCSTLPSILNAQIQEPGPEFEVLKSDLGTWDAEIKAWQGPGEPTITKGSETNKMLGGFWKITEFKGNLFGFDFDGHGIYGYDPEKKKYIGTWIDSLGAPKMDVVGTYDAKTKTMKYAGMALAPDGTMQKHTMTNVDHPDGTRTMTMHVGEGDKAFKMLEIKYTKKK